MTPIDRTDPVIMGHILSEHRELFEQLSTLRTMLATESPPGCERLRELVRAIATLRRHLADHFRQEETGGFLEEAVARMPRLGSAASDVLGQHPQLLGELDAIVARFGDADVAPCADAWLEVHRAFEGFMRRMQEHERAENAVVQQGYNEDLGLDD